MNRRGFLQALGISPIAAPTALKEAIAASGIDTGGLTAKYAMQSQLANQQRTTKEG